MDNALTQHLQSLTLPHMAQAQGVLLLLFNVYIRAAWVILVLKRSVLWCVFHHRAVGTHTTAGACHRFDWVRGAAPVVLL